MNAEDSKASDATDIFKPPGNVIMKFINLSEKTAAIFLNLDYNKKMRNYVRCICKMKRNLV